MRHLVTRARWLAATGAAALTLAACGGAGGDQAQTDTDDATQESPAHTATSPDSPTAGADPFALLKQASDHVGPGGSSQAVAGGIAQAAGLDGDVRSPAAELYANLGGLLQEHVYLAGIAIDTGLSFGLDSPTFEAAASALDSNSVALAELVGSVAPDQQEAFLELWRQHIGFFVDYAKAAAEGNEEGTQQARQNLDDYRAQAGAFFEQVTGGALPADAVAQELQGHVATVIAAIDAAVAGDTSVFDKLKIASDHVDAGGSAKALAAGIAQAAGMEGSVDSPAATTYAQLASLLEEHVYLAGIAVKTAYTAGADSEAFTAATETLDANSVLLADLVGSVAGQEKQEAFLDLWRQHIGFFVDYAVAAAGGDEQAKQQAVSNLDDYRAQAGAFFEEITGGALPADAVAQELQGHVQTLTAAIDALAAALVE